MSSTRTTHSTIQRQRGAVFIVMLVFMVMGVVTFLVTSLNSSAIQIKRDQVTADALAQARDALIGRAVADATSPGSLPCPDINNDGSSETLFGNCTNYIGRLPWKTLGLPDLRDGYGERLWYALSPNFRDNAAANPINSNSKGNLQVFDNSGVTSLTSEAVAIIFSPGSVTGLQQRDTANENLPQNYLDIGPNGVNNFTVGGPFIAADRTNTFNDRLMIIKASDIIPTVEMRVAKELTTAFASYLPTNSNRYPYPANFTNCSSTNCPGDPTQCIGKIPTTDLLTFLPAWFKPNNWFDVIYYTAGINSLPGGGGGGGGGGGRKGKGKKGGGSSSGGGGGSPGCTAFLTVFDSNGTLITNNASALFLLPDVPLTGQTRAINGINSTNLANYFEDIENQNLDNAYIMPTAISNDSLYILP